MLTKYDAQKVQRDMKQELDAAPGVVLKCAVGLLILVALAVIGSAFDLHPNDRASNVVQAQ